LRWECLPGWQATADIGERAKTRFEARLKTPGGKNIVSLARPFDDPLPADVRDLDLITFLFFYHDTTYMPVDRAEMNRKLYAALKPGGMLVIADHSAKPGDGTSVGKSLHRIEESALRREVEAAGFKLVAEGDVWRLPEDARDFLDPTAKRQGGRRVRVQISEADMSGRRRVQRRSVLHVGRLFSAVGSFIEPPAIVRVVKMKRSACFMLLIAFLGPGCTASRASDKRQLQLSHEQEGVLRCQTSL
jgi:hypothetical protein